MFAKLQDNCKDVDIIIFPIFQMTCRSLVGLSNFPKDLQLVETEGACKVMKAQQVTHPIKSKEAPLIDEEAQTAPLLEAGTVALLGH